MQYNEFNSWGSDLIHMSVYVNKIKTEMKLSFSMNKLK